MHVGKKSEMEKRLVGLLLDFSMCLSLCAPAFAEKVQRVSADDVVEFALSDGVMYIFRDDN